MNKTIILAIMIITIINTSQSILSDKSLLIPSNVTKSRDNICYGEQNGIISTTYPCIAQSINGRNIEQYINYSIKSIIPVNTTLSFTYDSILESFHVYLFNNSVINETYNETEHFSEVTSYLEIINGTPESGDLKDPKYLLSITKDKETIIYGCDNYTISSYGLEDPELKESIKITDIDISWLMTRQLIKGWQETSIIQTREKLMNENINNYLLNLNLTNNVTQIKWVYTPLNKTKNGEWHKFALINNYTIESSKGLPITNFTYYLNKSITSNKDYYYEDPWWNNSWTHSVNLSINKNKITAQQTNFPILVNLSGNRIQDWNALQSTCQDFRFIWSDGTTALPYEIDYCNITEQKAYFWVTIPTLNASANTVNSSLTAYFGNALAPNGQNITGVWSLAGYNHVYHLNGLTDSALAGGTLTVSGAVTLQSSSSCQVGRCYLFSGGYLYNSSSMGFTFGDSNRLFEAYIKLGSSTYTGNKGIISTCNTQGDFVLGYYNISGTNLYVTDQYSWQTSYGTYETLSLPWKLLEAEKSGVTYYLFENGTQTATHNNLNELRQYGFSNGFKIGILNDVSGPITGYIDEVRTALGTKTIGWINATYYSINDSLITYGLDLSQFAITSGSATPSPIEFNNNNISFSFVWSSTNSSDLAKLEVCRTNSLNGTVCNNLMTYCENTTYILLGTTPLCNYTIQLSDMPIGAKNYYAFLCSLTGNCTSSFSGTFTIQNTVNPVINQTSINPITVRPAQAINLSWNQYDFSVINVTKINITSYSGITDSYNGISGNGIKNLLYNNTWRGTGNYTYLIWVNDSTNGLITTSTGTFMVNLNTTALSNISRVYDESSLEREINTTTHDILDNQSVIINYLSSLNISVNDLNISISDLNTSLVSALIDLNNNITNNIGLKIDQVINNISFLVNMTDCTLINMSSLCNYLVNINNSLSSSGAWSINNVTLALSRLDWLYNEVGTCKYHPDDGLCQLLRDASNDIYQVKEGLVQSYNVQFNISKLLNISLPNLSQLSLSTLNTVQNATFNTGKITEQSAKTINLAVVIIIIGFMAFCLILWLVKSK